ncbi:hypothetical protein [Nocardioides marmotae]|uniref:ESX-1 secretion-associated protein n=1 Tax=Nocardioides marmotae TaxID=2663857 RepID=A0A6I3JF64_9ACTN|nr:hypothetical protein [Nocardioides marmotae]MCR6033063.1 hypothetical protein [Gordonia jinghuaiqii]MBC9732562.1 hypothetical protein [Nocardioides marmotae]MTB83681.1 hypothetical protein [Nocardioides marmotae]MTB96715.1 hypothetical protein [Nocardioides marmotae]QKE03074.1 hypothetical protein HPC71_19925 [Nocardioides marmotae]
MTNIQITDADARAIAALHESGAEGIEGTAESVPDKVDGGEAAAVLGKILAKLVTDADDLAIANRATAGVMRSVANDYYDTDAEVGSAFADLVADVDPGGAHP